MKNVIPVKMIPHLEFPIWKGRKLRSEWNVQSTEDIGEGFFMSTLPKRESVVAEGIHKGKTLTELINEYPDYTLAHLKELPLLFKLIDTADRLSVQVHPNDEYALKNENQLGKTESWLILDADESSYIYFGLNDDYTPEQVAAAIADNTVENLLNKIYVKKGDYFYIGSGTIHALGKNITVAEIQQSSMVTYRLYDYDRRDKFGNPRQLHIRQSLDVINYKKTDTEAVCSKLAPVKDTFVTVDSKKYFTVQYAKVENEVFYHADDYCMAMITDGQGTLYYDEGKLELTKGDCVFIPASCSVKFVEKLDVIVNKE